MSISNLLKDESPEQAVKTIKKIQQTLADRNALIMRSYNRIVATDEWRYTMAEARREKWENRLYKKKTRLKKYIIPEALMYADLNYWKEAVKDHKYMKQYHPELII